MGDHKEVRLLWSYSVAFLLYFIFFLQGAGRVRWDEMENKCRSTSLSKLLFLLPPPHWHKLYPYGILQGRIFWPSPCPANFKVNFYLTNGALNFLDFIVHGNHQYHFQENAALMHLQTPWDHVTSVLFPWAWGRAWDSTFPTCSQV